MGFVSDKAIARIAAQNVPPEAVQNAVYAKADVPVSVHDGGSAGEEIGMAEARFPDPCDCSDKE